MTVAATSAGMLVRITGLILIVLGVLFWFGLALPLIPLHTVIGIVLVLSLWTLAILAAGAGVGSGLVFLGLVWGVIVLVLGLVQTDLLPGPAHWVVQVVHLLVGLAAIGLGEALATRIGRARPRASRGERGARVVPNRPTPPAASPRPPEPGNESAPGSANYRPHHDDTGRDEIQ